MIGLIFAAALLQAQAPASCNAAAAPYPPAAGCPQWRLIRHQYGAAGYHDPASVRLTGTGFDVTIRILYDADFRGARSTIMRGHYDCTRRTWMIMELGAYDVAGGTILDGPYPDDTPSRQEADTPGDDLMNQYCPRPAPTG